MDKLDMYLLLTLVCIIGYVSSSGHGDNEIHLECAEGWTLNEDEASCYRYFSQAMEYMDAHHTCESYGSELVSIFGYEENRAVGEMVNMSSPEVMHYWIGLYVDYEDDEPEEYEDMVNSGFWKGNQPHIMDTNLEHCTAVSITMDNYYTYGYSFMGCMHALPFVCEAKPCYQGQFRCANGKCITNTPCDMVDDCDDGSDEMDCPDNHRHYLTGESGSFSTDNTYAANSDIMWVIETPVGTKVSLTFANFRTEKYIDEVTIWTGALTVPESHMLTRLSGELDVGTLPTYNSPNNMMILRFISDSEAEDAGFTAEWVAIEEVSGAGGELEATDAAQKFTSPMFPNLVLPALRETWVIKAPLRRRVITLMVNEFDLPRDAMVMIYDGEDIDAMPLAMLEGGSKHNPHVIVSTMNVMTVYLHSDKESMAHQGFEFSYMIGCGGSFEAHYGEIISPGYNAMIHYPNYQTCMWTVTNPDGNEMSMSFDDNFDIVDAGDLGVDVLSVYADAAGTSMLLDSANGNTKPSQLRSTTGVFHVVFNTSAVMSSVGFKAVFSQDCEAPNFSAETDTTPDPFGVELDDEIIVTCPTGYYFGQEEHIEEASITVVCEAGGWSVDRLPKCEPVVCGQPPLIDNGYVDSATGVTFEETVTYACYGGYSISGTNPITCQSDNTWEAEPTCDASTCASATAPTNGAVTVEHGDGTAYGSVVMYMCDDGYQIVGDPMLLCGGGSDNDEWSNDEPTCEKLHCPMVEIEHGTLSPVLGEDEWYVFEDAVTVTCDEGYELDDGGLSPFTCQGNQTYTVLPECVDIDECLDDSTCDQDCHNTDGSFMCSCAEGWELDSDNTTCNDINECDDNPCDPDHGSCSNEDGGYTCTCTTAGWELYTSDGDQGVDLCDNEGGMAEDDLHRLNHTCVRVMCPSPPALTNGKILNTQTNFVFEDEVHFFCDLGYVLTGPAAVNNANTSVITCQDDGTWDFDPPTCEVATCELPDLSDLSGPFVPTLAPSTGTVNYGDSVTLTCTEKVGPNDFVTTRKCGYDYVNMEYNIDMGASLACPVIDCGDPTTHGNRPSGTSLTTPADNYYDAKLTISCATGFTNLENVDDANGNTDQVSCDLDGNWNFGEFRCQGDTCDDPGTPAGMRQIPSGTYEEGQTVSYECERTGFTLSSEDPLTCEIGLTVDWDGSPPTCSDTEVPVITQDADLCNQGTPLTVRKLTNPGFAIPTATDNDGTDETVMSFTVNPAGFRPDVAVNQDVVVTYTAEDAAGNSADCVINIVIEDDIWPDIVCPEGFAYELTSQGSETIDPSTLDNVATATDDTPGETPTITYSPATINVDGTSHNTFQVVTATATDVLGHEVSCRYTIAFRAPECSDWNPDYPAPYNGARVCARNGGDDGWDCTYTCEAGAYFFERPADASVVWSCTDGGTFGSGVFDKSFDCIYPDYADFHTTNIFDYDTTSAANTEACKAEYRQDFITKFAAAADTYTGYCTQEFFGDTSGGYVRQDASGDRLSFTFDDPVMKVQFSYEVGPANFTVETRVNCAGLVDIILKTLPNFGTSKALRTISGTGCPDLVIPNDLDNGEFRTDLGFQFSCQNDRIQHNFSMAEEEKQICMPCPYGYIYNSTNADKCEMCGFGTYTDDVDQTMCMDCPDDKNTYSEGAKSEDECYDTCMTVDMVNTAGRGLPPCSECPKDEYATDAETCTACTGGKVTTGTGKADISDCIETCGVGYYTDTGAPLEVGGLCESCPLHFYVDEGGATDCVECPSAGATDADAAGTSACNFDPCATNPCVNSGTCTVIRHKAVCTCGDGWTGETCETVLDFCASAPCYYTNQGTTCTNTPTGYTCACPDATYSGDRCENEPDNCPDITCENGGMCRDLVAGAECLCPTGFTGATCSETTQPCDTDNGGCENGATCTNVNAQRRVCTCPPGFMGVTCDHNIDDCASNPCLYGYTCNDGDNEYTCDCDDGYSGDNCEVRPDVCAANCGNTGVCVDDFRNRQFLCACDPGYEAPAISHTDKWYDLVTGITDDDTNCDEIDYCNPDPCDNGAACSSTNHGPECACMPGYDGCFCQNNIMECKSHPCMNGATCMDAIPGFSCDCASGWEGQTCEDDIDECAKPSYPCVAQGTDESQGNAGCTDMVNGYMCHCLPGYEGIDCSIDIDECANEPCYHNATCSTDGLVADYMCECVEGWEGKNCDEIVDNCVGDPCDNDAMCESVFNDFFCECDFPNYGKTCSDEALTCDAVNPCIDPNAECEETAGIANCSCSADFMGDNCEVAVDYCEQDNICRFGGHCRTELDGFECECKGDFFGDNCQTSADDCNAVTCGGGGTCVDGNGEYFCHCPIGKMGPDCDKDVDRDFDIIFDCEDKTSHAYQLYPFEMNPDVFTVGLWVRFAHGDEDGTFFTLYGLEHQYRDAPRQEILRMDQDNVYINEDEMFPFSLYDINDKQWYFITVSWDNSGHMEVRVNSVRVAQTDGLLEGKSLYPYGWIVLGAHLDHDGEPVEDEGFNGYISKVNVWNKILDTSTEIPPMADDRDTLIEDGLIQTWQGYLTSGCVHFHAPSEADDEVCPEGMMGDNCDQMMPDKEPPMLTCTDEFHRFGETRITPVTYDEPMVVGTISSSLVAKYSNNKVFTWGKYVNTIKAEDANGNIALCSFPIFIRRQDCENPEPSISNGEVDCSVPRWPYKTCAASCDEGHDFSVKTPYHFTCGPQGSFNVDNAALHFTYPACSVKAPSKYRVHVKLIYRAIQACEEVMRIDGFGVQIRKRITEVLNPSWGEEPSDTPPSPSNGFCHGSDCSAIVVNMTCGDDGLRRKRATADAIIDIFFENLQATLFNADGVELPPIDILLQDILDALGFDFSDIIDGATPDETALLLENMEMCEEGQTLIGEDCVDCGQGTMYDSTTMTCRLCPIGTYQDETKQTMCKECTGGATTELEGTKSNTLCKPSCNAGSYFDTDDTICHQCPIGFYQELDGQFFCAPCDADKTTVAEGTVFESDCYQVCESGTEIAANGSCVPCPIGTYRTLGSEAMCTQCDPGFITETEASVSESQCTIPDCQPGTYHDEDIGVCENCDVGFYQDEKWQTECKVCDPGKTTTGEQSTMESDCMYFCPLGQEEDDQNPGTCVLCEIGFFKDNAIPGQSCASCASAGRPSYVTTQPGAIDKDNCTRRACNAGEQPNEDNTGCEPCPRGTYQPQQYQAACEECADGSTTREERSTSDSQCEEYCEDGYERDLAGDCVMCARGYYRNNTEFEFGMCEMCDPDYITPAEGATSEADCTERNCSAGSMRNTVSNECELCDIGSYQPDNWQTMCIDCEEDKTTADLGSTSIDHCLISCSAGEEDVGGVCEECGIGYYKETEGATACTPCDPANITADTGSTSAADCNIANCQVGTYRDVDENTCYECPVGQYQDKMWQTACVPCGTGTNGKPLTTDGMGSVSDGECFLMCDNGYGYSYDSGTCELCPIGYFRTEGIQAFCTICSDLDKITAAPGAIAETLCIIANCSAGYKTSELRDSCEECPLGTYQDEKWQDECDDCPMGQTTMNTTSTSALDCLRNCPSGQELNLDTNLCEDCDIGFYRTQGDSFFCEHCPGDLITAEKGATSVDMCDTLDCSPGFKVMGDDCEPCPVDTYQPDRAQSMCIPCPDDSGTMGEAATSMDNCTSTNQCLNPDENDCLPPDQNGMCMNLPETEPPGYMCGCMPGYMGGGTEDDPCQDKCDLDYCLNDGECTRMPGEDPECECTSQYTGDRCQERKAPQSNTPIIIGSIAGGVALIALIAALIFCCLRSPGSAAAAGGAKVIPPMAVASPYGTAPSTMFTKPAPRYAASNVGTISMYQPANNNMFPAQDNQSVTGYSGGYMFYADTEDGAQFGPKFQMTQQSQLGMSPYQQDDQFQTMTFQ